MPKSAEEQEGLPKKTFAIIFGVSLVTAMGNTGMISVLPAIGRSIGIPDPMVAAIFSLSALLWAFSSPWWARASDRHGRKPLMLIGLSGFMFSMIACALVVMAGLHKLAAPMVIFVLFLFARALFGLFGAASNPATQAYVAEHTPPEKRTQSMSSLAGAFGLGTVIGPFIAPLFVLPFVGLSGPMLGFALLGLSFGQSSGALSSNFQPRHRYTGSAFTSDLAWLFGAGFAPMIALWLSSQFGLIAAGAYLLSGAVVTLVALWLNRELASTIG